MRDLIPEWIDDYEGFQEMPLEMSAEIDWLLETNRITMSVDLVDIRGFLAERYKLMQDEIDKWKAASASGSQVLLMSKEERAGWDARVEAEELERATKNVSTECYDEVEEGECKEELGCENANIE